MPPQRTQSPPPPSTRPEPVWDASGLADPHGDADKPAKVRRMFAAIAPSYDLNNRLHSLGRDAAWRRYAARRAELGPGMRALDAACGTGDLTHLLARSGADEVIGLDFTRAMLDVAERKRAALPSEVARRVRYVEGDAMALPFEDASFDAVTIAFGIRNVADPRRAMREFARVLKPGGRVVILEFHRPRSRVLQRFHDAYCGWLMPRTATLISRDRSGAYRYLPASVGAFMSREELAAALTDAGFTDVRSRAMTLGVCACTSGRRAGPG